MPRVKKEAKPGPGILDLTENLRKLEAERVARLDHLMTDPEYRRLSREVEAARTALEKAREARGITARLNVSLDDQTADFLRKLGDGNLSAGIREAASRVQALKKGKDAE